MVLAQPVKTQPHNHQRRSPGRGHSTHALLPVGQVRAPTLPLSPFFLDDDYNPLNGNAKLLSTISAPVTGPSSLGSGTISVPLYATNAAPGWHAFFATITASGQRRYLYAPEPVQVLSSQAPPALSIARIAPGKYQLAVTAIPGQTLTLQTSTNLSNWLPLATNTIAASPWLYTNTPPTDMPAQFYRAALAP